MLLALLLKNTFMKHKYIKKIHRITILLINHRYMLVLVIFIQKSTEYWRLTSQSYNYMKSVILYRKPENYIYMNKT